MVRGAIVLIPLAILAILVGTLIDTMAGVLAPISNRLPGDLNHPKVAAAIILLVTCLVLGLLVRTRLGRRAYAQMEVRAFNKIPGYQPARALARKMAGESDSEEFSVALVEMDDALVPGFVVEHHDDDRYTILVPSVPTPLAGALYILPRHRVHVVDVPMRTAMACFTHWGAGTSALLAAYRKDAPERLNA